MKTYDVIGVGAGPANLSLAALSKKTSLNTLLIEKQKDFIWHLGMLLPEAKLQVSYLKDLVTLVDPTNPYSFLSYLHHKQCLYQFITVGFEKIYRTEFNDYLKWVFTSLSNIEKAQEVIDVGLHEDGELIVKTSTSSYLTKNLVLGCGLIPYIPDCSVDHIGEQVFHNHNFLPNNRDFKNKEVAIIGGGQSGAEVVNHLLNIASPSKVYWFSKRVNFLPIDDSPFTNELYTPKYSDYFYELSDNDRKLLLDKQKLSSDGVAESTLRAIYEQLYYTRFIKKADSSLRLHPNSKLIEIKNCGDKKEIIIKHNQTPEFVSFKVDYVIICTGYVYKQPKFLTSLVPLLEHTGKNFKVNNDYSLSWKEKQSSKIFIQNGAKETHGVADPNLSLLAYRSAKILNSILGYPFYDMLDGCSIIDWEFKESV